ncbi:NERD domain-containing protein [Nocardia thailandica]|uniref:NERD domain-containing protein n=1 Tax=Nocardia thailandica TaxID=257275 RepID=A0ABW6PPE8_9NOCA
MIVVVADGTELDGAEQVVGRAMRDWDPSIGGVAVFRCHVPEYRGGSVEVDALVCTPRGVTVVEVKGFTARQNGTLVTPANGPWKVGDDLAALYHPDRAPNPFLQVRRQVFATKNLLQRAGITGWVNAVITLLPQPWARVAYDETRLADGYRVLIADRNGCVALREYFRSEIGRTVRLSIDDVATVFHTLNLDHLLPSPEDLAAHGFPDEFQTVGDRRPAPERAAGPGFLAAIDRLGRGDSGSSADGREAGTTPETDTRPVINLRKDADIERELAADAAHGSPASRAAGSSNKIAVGSLGAGGTGAGTAGERASSGGDSGDDRDAPGAGDTGERTVPDPRETVRGVDGARPDTGDAPRATSPGDEADHGRDESPAGEGGPAVDGTDREQGASRGRLRGIVTGVAAAGVIGAGAAALARKRRSAREGDAQADRSDDGTDVDRAAEPRADHPTERPAELDRAAPGAESDDGLDVSGGEDTGARVTALDVPGDGEAGAPDTAGTRAAIEADAADTRDGDAADGRSLGARRGAGPGPGIGSPTAPEVGEATARTGVPAHGGHEADPGADPGDAPTTGAGATATADHGHDRADTAPGAQVIAGRGDEAEEREGEVVAGTGASAREADADPRDAAATGAGAGATADHGHDEADTAAGAGTIAGRKDDLADTAGAAADRRTRSSEGVADEAGAVGDRRPGDAEAGTAFDTRDAVEAASAAAGTRTAAESDPAAGGDGQDNDTADRRSVDTETRTPPETDTATGESEQDNDTAGRRGADTGAAGRSAGERRANDGRGGEPAEADAAGDGEADTHGDARPADSDGDDRVEERVGDGRDRKQAADARVAATETDDAPDRGGRARADSADSDVEEDDDVQSGRTLRGVAAGAALAGAVGAGVLAARAARSRRDDDHDRDQDQDQDQDRDRLDGRDLGSERDDTERTSSDEGRSLGADGDEWGDARRIAPEEDRFPDADNDAHAAGRDHAERNAPARDRFPDTSTDERDTGRDHTRGTASEEARHSDHADYADHADGDDDERGAGWRGERQRDDRDESGRRHLGAWRAHDDERDDADGYAVDADDYDGRDHDDASGYDDREPGTDPDDGRAYDDSPGGHFHARTAEGEFDHVDGAFQQLRGEPVPAASGGAQWWQPNQPAPAPKWRPELPGFVRGRGRSGPGRAGRAAKVARQAPARRRPRIGPGIGLVLVLVLFGATFYGVTAVAASRFVVADYDRLCGDETKTFPKAAEFADAGARPVRLAGDLAGMVPAGGPAWHPEDPGEVQLVACLRQTGMGDLVQTCWYPPSEAARVARTVNLFRATYQLVVYEARTRREVARADLVGERYSDDPASTEPDRCRAAASAPDVLGRRLGQPSSGQVTAVLAPLVRDR